MSTKTGVKTKKVKKRRLKIKGVLFLMLLFGSVFLLAKTLYEAKINTITVKGNSYLKDSTILKGSELTENTKFLGFRAKKTCNKLLEDPLIKTCDIKRTLDFKVEIHIEENEPILYYSNDKTIILSDNAHLDAQNTYGVPTLINYVPEDILKEFISGLSGVKSDIIRSINEIEYTPSTGSDGTYIDKERFMLSMTDGNTVYINNRRLETLNYYEKIYASLGDKKGVLSLDCDFGNYPFTEYGE